MYGLLIQHPMDAQFEGCFHAGQHANDKFVQRKIIYVQHYLFIFGIAKKKKKVSIRYIYFSLTIPLLRSTGINITYLDTGEGSECLCMYLGLSAEVPGMYTKLRIMLKYIINNAYDNEQSNGEPSAATPRQLQLSQVKAGETARPLL
jgi:hypothetical protein